MSRFLSVDPGLDTVAIAVWEWATVNQVARIQSIELIRTSTDEPLASRLQVIQTACRQFALDWPVSGVVIEQPNRGGAYDRNRGIAEAVLRRMYLSALGAGAAMVGFTAAGARVELLEVGEVKKGVKQQQAHLLLTRERIALPGRRTVWSADELDAVAVGMQAIADWRYRWLATAPASVTPAPTEFEVENALLRGKIIELEQLNQALRDAYNLQASA